MSEPDESTLHKMRLIALWLSNRREDLAQAVREGRLLDGYERGQLRDLAGDIVRFLEEVDGKQNCDK